MGAPRSSVAAAVRIDRIVAAHAASATVVRRTPLLTSASVSQLCSGTVALKAECLQRTGSFKLRGALNKLRALGAEASRGVVAGSAGNHAQALAYAARHHGVPCEVFMPLEAAVSKLDAVRAFGAEVHQRGSSVDECVALAREHAQATGLTFVHSFDDYDVIAGQAGLGVELAEDAGDLRQVVVPVGGGGLASGVALALAQLRPAVRVVGVQAAACAPFVADRRGGARVPPPSTRTIADGIAVKRPGALTRPLVEEWLDDVITVDEEAIAQAMVLLLTRSKLLVEGAGAAALAALLNGAIAPVTGGTTVAILSGGNVDVGMIAGIAAHQETRAGRRSRLFTRIDDRPGGLAGLLAAVADASANVIAVEHVRDGVPLAVRETGIELIVETRGAGHRLQLLSRLHDAGYAVDVAD
ncbi:threonine ammonia-lyase [Conexibacter sp. CPCC 206217]|uniref:threonine ammonia-lyase n=1 Tax=Conexibacter sp. CPCC 206217 TaxID=3064574 RepID=UPI00271F748B|nr:threonine ammonia-lyase [Conexibacter sp. CPCC 206217]MDO8210210.1 threonine ammonia-lyase [Conexibacter sp. CPCC 206217]